MRSAVVDLLPARVRRSLEKLGGDIVVARKRRHLTVAMMAERVGVASATYLRAERGDPTVAMAVYAMIFFALGLGEPLANVIDASHDEHGLLLAAEQLPQRIRLRRGVGPR